MSELDMFKTIEREIRSAEAQLRPVVQIRVTADAIPGTITTAPMTPERARNLGRLLAIEDRDGEQAVVSDPRNELLLEILIHPDDWRALLAEAPRLGASLVDLSEPVTRVCGIPVSQPEPRNEP